MYRVVFFFSFSGITSVGVFLCKEPTPAGTRLLFVVGALVRTLAYAVCFTVLFLCVTCGVSLPTRRAPFFCQLKVLLLITASVFLVRFS